MTACHTASCLYRSGTACCVMVGMQTRLAHTLVLQYSNKYCVSTLTTHQHGRWLEAIDCKNEMMHHNMLRTGVVCQKGFVMRNPRHLYSARPTTDSAARFEISGNTQRYTRAQLLEICWESAARASAKGCTRRMQNCWMLPADALALGCVESSSSSASLLRLTVDKGQSREAH